MRKNKKLRRHRHKKRGRERRKQRRRYRKNLVHLVGALVGRLRYPVSAYQTYMAASYAADIAGLTLEQLGTSTPEKRWQLAQIDFSAEAAPWL